MADVKATFQDPDFLGLPEEEQIKVLSALDKEFAKFDRNTQLEVLQKGLTVPGREREKKTLGTFVGGVAGGLAALRGGGLGRSVLGTGIGGALGRRIDQIREAKSSVVPQTIEEFKQMASPTREDFKDMLKAGATEAAYEAGGGLIFKGARRALAPFKGVMDDTAKSLNNYLAKRMAEKGYKTGLLPQEMASGDSWFLTLFQNISEGALLGGGHIKRFKSARGEVLADIADDIVKSYGRNAKITDLSNMFVNTIQGRQSYHQAISKSLYNTVSETTRGTLRIPTRAFKEATTDVKKIADEINKIGGETAGYDLLGKIATLEDSISYDAAIALKHNLWVAGDVFKAQSTKAGGVQLAKKMTHLIDEAIEKQLKAFDAVEGTTAYRQWRTANEFHRNWKTRLDNAVIRRLVHYMDDTGRGGAFIAPDIIKNPETAKRVKAALGEGSEEWRKMQGFYIQDLFRRSADVETMREIIKHGKVVREAEITGTNLLKQITGTPTQLETFHEFFNPVRARRINRFADALMATQRKQKEGIGKMWIQLTQGGAVMGFATGLAPEAAGLLLTPGIMAKMLTTEKGAKYLTEGIKTLKGDPRVAGLGARILKEVIKIGNEEEKRRKQPEAKKEFVYGPEWS
jgi:hypothetical protein